MAESAGRRKLGIALSGGATRGLAHVGVLEALEENGVRPDFISGTSIGAFGAALYAFGVPIEEIRATVMGLSVVKVSKLKLTRFGLFSHEDLGRVVRSKIGRAGIEEATIPLAIVAADVGTGEKVVLRQGETALAVMASSALPGIYQPVVIGGRVLVDGGIVENVPVSPLRPMGADVVAAVNLSAERRYRDPEDIIDVLFNSFDIAIDENTKEQIKRADIPIEPRLPYYKHVETSKYDEFFTAGRQAATEAIPKILEELNRPGDKPRERRRS
jgi:NTE family protein